MMNRDDLFGGFPMYKPGSDWSTIVINERRTNELLEMLGAPQDVGSIVGVQIKTNKFVPNNMAIVQDSNGNTVAVLEIQGD